mgnify:CR=1 FL=1
MKVDRNPETYFRDNDLVPFVGVVENISDPLQIGRVQVRAIGFHPEQSDGVVPTDHLPWAYVALPTTASGMSGVGSTHGLVDGSWVFGYFLDGRDAQQPFVMATFVGAPGLSNLQREYVKSGLAVSSSGPGGLASAFQTAASKVVGGLGAASKFGATGGGLFSLVDALKNNDFFKTLTQFSGISSTGQVAPKVSDVVDAAAARGMSDAVAATASQRSTSRSNVATILPQILTGIFSAGGAKGFSQSGGSPLSAASFGTFAGPSEEPTAEKSTVEVRTDYDALAASAPDNVGALTVYSTGTPKNKRYTLDVLEIDHAASAGSDGKGAPYHFLIDQTGTVIKSRDQSQPGGAGQAANSPSVGGSPMGNIQVALVGGGGPAGPVASKYFPAQLHSLEKLVDSYVRRFPKMVVAGGTEFDRNSRGPGFNVSEWAATRWPNNTNSSGSEVKLAPSSGVQPASSNVSAAGQQSWDQSGGYVSSSDDTSPVGERRGFQGGPSHPNPAYAAKRQSDVPAMARSNALSALGRGTAGIGTASGGPVQQYLAKMEEPSTKSFAKARMADTLEARAIPEKWVPPTNPHGGEYGSTHVVRSTEAGHHILLDDTSGRQKVEIMHSSGSMIQIHADGSGMFYVKGDSHEVVIGTKYLGIQGGLHIAVGGDMKVSVQGDLAYDVTGKISFNGASSMHELIRGDRTTVTEGSHLFQAKKNAVHRVGKDMSQQVGGKMDTAVRGSRHDSTDGNASTSVRGEASEFVAGNKSSLTVGSSTDHAQNRVLETTGDNIVVSKGNTVVSSKGKMTVVGDGTAVFESKGATKIISGGQLDVTASGPVNLHASGSVDVDGSTINLNSGTSSAATGADTADVTAPPAQLTREANPAASPGNLNSEQVTRGGIDAAEARDNSGETGSTAPGGINSGGAASGSDPSFNPATSQGEVSAGALGNYRGDACSIANQLVSKGWSKEGASAIVGNMINESSLRPVASTIDVNSLRSGGLVQWNGGRFEALKQFSAANGMNWATVEAQVAYLDHESRTTEAGAGMGMINATDIESAIRASANFERFQGYNNGGFSGGAWTNGNGNRAGNALGVYNECFGQNVQSVGGQNAGNVQQYTSGGGAGGGGGGGDGSSGGSGDDSSSVSQGTNETGSNKAINGPYAQGGAVDWSRQVSPNYTLGNLTPTCKFHEGLNATPQGSISSDQLITNLSGCAVNVLEPMMSGLGKPHVMSGYRSLAYNNSLGTGGSTGRAKNSDHIYGRAVDIQVPGYSPAHVANWVEANLPNVAGIGRYPTFVHVSFYLEGNHGRIRRWGHT